MVMTGDGVLPPRMRVPVTVTLGNVVGSGFCSDLSICLRRDAAGFVRVDFAALPDCLITTVVSLTKPHSSPLFVKSFCSASRHVCWPLTAGAVLPRTSSDG